MERFMEIRLEKRGVGCVAWLLDDDAPLTAEIAWSALTPGGDAWHAKSGRGRATVPAGASIAAMNGGGELDPCRSLGEGGGTAPKRGNGEAAGRTAHLASERRRARWGAS
jgi:hypothetical protein